VEIDMPKLIVDVKTGVESKMYDTLQLLAYSKMDSRGVQFNQKTHRYCMIEKILNPTNGDYNLFPVPSVTQILSLISKYPKVKEPTLSMERGRYIHKCCELLMLDKLGDIDSEDLRYIEAWRKFLLDYRLMDNSCLLLADVAIETPMVNTEHLYAGKIDFIFSYHRDKLLNVYINKDGKYKVRERKEGRSMTINGKKIALTFNDFLYLKRVHFLRYL
jgi:hypothetical protein